MSIIIDIEVKKSLTLILRVFFSKSLTLTLTLSTLEACQIQMLFFCMKKCSDFSMKQVYPKVPDPVVEGSANQMSDCPRVNIKGFILLSLS